MQRLVIVLKLARMPAAIEGGDADRDSPRRSVKTKEFRGSIGRPYGRPGRSAGCVSSQSKVWPAAPFHSAAAGAARQRAA